jgi:hypothetical protein
MWIRIRNTAGFNSYPETNVFLIVGKKTTIVFFLNPSKEASWLEIAL